MAEARPTPDSSEVRPRGPHGLRIYDLIVAVAALGGAFAVYRAAWENRYRDLLLPLWFWLASLSLWLLSWYIAARRGLTLGRGCWLGFFVSSLFPFIAPAYLIFLLVVPRQADVRRPDPDADPGDLLGG